MSRHLATATSVVLPVLHAARRFGAGLGNEVLLLGRTTEKHGGGWCQATTQRHPTRWADSGGGIRQARYRGRETRTAVFSGEFLTLTLVICGLLPGSKTLQEFGSRNGRRQMVTRVKLRRLVKIETRFALKFEQIACKKLFHKYSSKLL